MSKTVTQSLHDSVEVHLRNSGRTSRCGQSSEIICTDITEGRHRWAKCRMHTLLSGFACSAHVLASLLHLHGSGIGFVRAETLPRCYPIAPPRGVFTRQQSPTTRPVWSYSQAGRCTVSLRQRERNK